MKKTFFSTVAIFLLLAAVGCGEQTLMVNGGGSGTMIYQTPDGTVEVGYDEGIYSGKTWKKDDASGTYNGNVIPDKETAVDVASQIHNSLFSSSDRVVSNVFYDTEDQIWIVNFSEPPKSDGTITVGGDYTIAIKRSTGEVVRMWGGE